MDAWELTAREEIRDLLSRYTWSGDLGRIDELTALFTPEGVLDVGPYGGRWVGHGEIQAGLMAVVKRLALPGERPKPVHHSVSSVLIDKPTGAGAKVSSYYAVHSAIGLDHWGRYIDTVELHIGKWRFAERVVHVDGAAANSRVVVKR